MATINVKPRVGKKSISWRARIRIKAPELPKGYYEESSTFKTELKAKHWAKERVKILEVQGIPNGDVPESEIREATLGTLIKEYLESDYNQDLGRSKRYALKALAKQDISLFTVSSLDKKTLEIFAKDRKLDGVKPYTVYQDIIYMRSVIEVAKSDFQINGDTDFIADFIAEMVKKNKTTPRHKRLIEFAAEERIVIPTKNEMELIRKELKKREDHRNTFIPYLEILDFAIATCMRVSEICRVEWGHFKIESKTLLIEDRKHPTDKIGNHQYIPLISGAFELLLKRKNKLEQELKEKGEKLDYRSRIFPYQSRSVTAGWQRCRKKLIDDGENVQNIRFHDLRAYGASILIDKNWALGKVSKITGHRDINVLNNIYNRVSKEKIAQEDFEERAKLEADGATK